MILRTKPRLILTTRIPAGDFNDRVAWSKAVDGQYSVKSGYHLWTDQNLGNVNVTQATGWGKIWRLDIPHKAKIFLWRFCRNNVPVRRRLSAKGVSLSITCPMCSADIEHKLHVFFDCPFATACWQYGVQYDMSAVEYAPDWLLQKLSNAGHEEIILIVRVLWGIWFFRNKRVWDNQVVNNVVAMDWSAKHFADWRKAKATRASLLVSVVKPCQPSFQRWKPPKQGTLKLNVDAAVKLGSENFSVGLVLRDHLGQFVTGKVVCLKMVSSVFEAEACAIHEGLQWLLSMQHQEVKVESDSLLSVQALNRHHDNHLEVGFILNSCRNVLFSRPGLSISFSKRQANKAAHLMAKIPCLLDCQSIFMSPPDMLLETLLLDSKF